MIDCAKVDAISDGIGKISARFDAMVKNDTDESEAFELGVKANRAGKSSTPSSDQSLMQLIKKANPSGEIGGSGGSTVKLLKAWAKGWHKTNLST